MARGQLRVYLGAAPGVGKTYAMLAEARRRRERGTDVVAGYVETHDRPRTEALLDGLESVPRRTLAYRGAEFTELDTARVIARAPAVVLVDELAHTNVPGSGHPKRWQDVEDILDAGIDVISTVNVQHLESVNDVVERITGVAQRETVPDEVVRRAGQVELVDMAPEALRRRMAHGNVYRPEKVDAALSNYFRVGNLTALRELALLWLAGKVDDQLDRYRADHGIGGTWEARERIVVALTGGPEGDTLLRRATRIAARSKGSDLLAVHVAPGDGLAGARPEDLARQRQIVEGLGGTYHQVVGDDVPRALLDFARGANATQLVLGVSRRGRFAQLLRPGIGVTTTARSGPIDVHMVTHDQARRGVVRQGRERGLSVSRRLSGFLLAAAGLPLLTFGLLEARPAISLPSDILFFLAAVVAIALVGGMWPALVTAVAGFVLLNWFFTPPVHRLTVAEQENLLALAVFVLVGIGVSAVVDRAARRSREAARLGAEAEVLSTLAGDVLRGEHALDAVLGRLRETFGLASVTLLERPAPGDGWRIVATVGGRPCAAPGEGDAEIPVGADLTLAVRGRPMPAGDRRVLEAFAVQAAGALRQQRLRAEAERARPLEAADRMRTALLNAVSHDLRTPLASAKAAVDSLGGTSVAWTDEERAELLDTARQSLDRLDRLVANLLDMSRLQAGVLGIAARPLALDEVVPRALDDIGGGEVSCEVSVRLDAGLPEVAADPALLERVLVNVIANALRHSPPGEPVLITAGPIRDRVELRIADRGPGIPPGERELAFLPFQRLGDRDNRSGVGLGLALARGLTEAMGGELVPEDTPGGGLTMIVSLPVHRRKEAR
ncbi:osmosensitive K+ channel signal transduction histidine kinase [Actinomadura madurae]|uniref:histidine kinase n=1 Tax=Actinomadura madurae TaxID=1993 RepID=A0A1I5REN5_9ACTN|nr:sensor histidine kinase KdpD [Actinomadura madurae]SFP56840.1 osmosensitive K+ channel signal transduction histidine kinase [Actinomadura madurae]